MKYLLLIVLLFPFVSSAQTLTPAQRQTIIKEIAVLEAELDALLHPVQTVTPIATSTIPTFTAGTTTTFNQDSKGVFEIPFKITAGSQDAYIPEQGVEYSVVFNTFSGTQNAVLTSEAKDLGGYYDVPASTTKQFELTVTLTPTTAGTYGISLTSITHDTLPGPQGAEKLFVSEMTSPIAI